MLEQLNEIEGIDLDGDEYLNDFDKTADKLAGLFWKFERRQSFQEPSNSSWLAAKEGDYEKAVRISRELMPAMRKQFEEEHFSEVRRVRVVEEPNSEYIRWQIMRLMQWSELGELVRILQPESIANKERNGRQLPEVTVIAEQVLYVVLYDDEGLLTGARKIVDPQVVRLSVNEVKQFWNDAEELTSYVERRPDALLTAHRLTA